MSYTPPETYQQAVIRVMTDHNIGYEQARRIAGAERRLAKRLSNRLPPRTRDTNKPPTDHISLATRYLADL